MKKVFKGLMIAAAVTMSAGVCLNAAADTAKLDQLLEQVKKNRAADAKLDAAREQEFLSDRADKQALLSKAKAAFAAEEARGKSLTKQFADNEGAIAAKEQELLNAQGTLGEMFGIVRGTATETIGAIATSNISAQFKGREDLLKKLSVAKELPTITELEELWIALQTEMTESAKVSKFDGEVTGLDGTKAPASVTRVGSFNLITDNGFLVYNADTKEMQPLVKQPESYVVSDSVAFKNAAAGELKAVYVDPTGGNLLRLKTQEATLEEQFHSGGTPGYVITVLLIIGLLISAVRFLSLTAASSKINSQLKNLNNPSTDNALGRILKVYHDNKKADVENLELKLDEAIMRETPAIEKGIGILKLIAAVGPLLGLLGTVVGMIGAFQMITLHGTGDPKIMAGSISMALVTTVQGLLCALPLLFLHSLLQSKSNSILHILDEQSAGIIAAHAEKERS
ncbi:MotA/TolQ/ExbB proton channel family protein [Rheinheimera sp. F8]|jgi:biopolymer transport protein ExbB|uniref:MotA/TolQ/ExbB proton channel family protein n=1 Tax=Rheinheimera sp. F8 TaxID=1763998 RepID=UPI0007449A40|nr:MotA/TolQ/ExbB proton channel family protein [Rheinheimera sp. F8]ALZ75023.1 flagellar motor protein MotA [Rheinheimera sp. F8]ALZ76551.1 flagellar motor protein MotA [Rheinheimera sp. F8]